MKLKLYVLKDRKAVPATEKEWAASLASPDRFVGQWVFADGTYVSTVFLGLDHRFVGKGPPLLYETMVFGGPMDQHQERTSTWEEAEQAHERVCREVRQRALQ
jgi:hypothetical protein